MCARALSGLSSAWCDTEMQRHGNRKRHLLDHLAGVEHGGVLAAQAHGAAAGLLDERHQALVHAPRQHHLHHVHRVACAPGAHPLLDLLSLSWTIGPTTLRERTKS